LPLPARLIRWRRWTLLSSALAALLSRLLWFLSTVASMTGSLAGITDPEAIASVLSATGFGKMWGARLALGAIVLGLIVVQMIDRPHRPSRLAVLLSAGLLGSLASVGHTQLKGSVAYIIHVTANSTHLLAAGAWLGGLLPLF